MGDPTPHRQSDGGGRVRDDIYSRRQMAEAERVTARHLCRMVVIMAAAFAVAWIATWVAIEISYLS